MAFNTRHSEKAYRHEHPVDNFWMVGGLPQIKLKELERCWQEDMNRLIKAKESEYDTILSAQSNELNSALATEKQLKEIYEAQNEELKRRLAQSDETRQQALVEWREREREKEIQHRKELDMQAAKLRAQFELEKEAALEQQRNDFLSELKKRDDEIDRAFTQHMKNTIEHLKQEHENNLNWRLMQLQSEGDKQIEELTEALREALRGGTPVGWLRL